MSLNHHLTRYPPSYRSLSSDHGVSMARLAGRYLDRGVLGLDVAGDEGSFPLATDQDPMAAAVRESQGRVHLIIICFFIELVH